MRIAILGLSFVLLIGGCSRQDETWIGELATLPAELHRDLLDRFDHTKELRSVRPEVRAPMEREIITDQRRWFEPSCTLSPGYSSTLFVGARQVGRFWVVHYQYGGIVHGAALLVLSRDDRGVFHECDRVFLRALEPSDKEIEDALKRSEEMPNQTPQTTPVSAPR